MTALRRIVLAALCAGLAAGAALTAIQTVKVLPLIAAAETWEHGGEGAAPAAFGAERLSLALGTNVLAGVAFALLLVAALSLAPPGDWRRGVAWGAAGFVAFSLAPAMGLAPGLPGTASAELGPRQLWWAGCAAATLGGIALFAFAPGAPARAGGIVLAALPHAIGAPGSGPGFDTVAEGGPPAALAAAFVGASLAANLVFWLIVGGLGAWAFSRLGGTAPAAPGR